MNYEVFPVNRFCDIRINHFAGWPSPDAITLSGCLPNAQIIIERGLDR